MSGKCKMQNAKCKMKNAAHSDAFCTLHFALCILPSIIGVFLVLGDVPSVAAAAQQSEPPKFVAVRVGLADRYKVGLWTQVEVTLRGGSEALSGEVSLIVPDGDGVPSRVSTPRSPVPACPGRETTVRLLCRFGRVAEHT